MAMLMGNYHIEIMCKLPFNPKPEGIGIVYSIQDEMGI